MTAPIKNDARELRPDWRAVACGLPAAMFYLLFFFIPLGGLVLVSLSERPPTIGSRTVSLFRSGGLLSDRLLWDILGFTLALAAVLTLVCLTLGFALALFIWSLHGRWKVLALFAVLIPKLSNLLVTAYGLKFLLGDGGPVNSVLTTLRIIAEPVPLIHNRLGVLLAETWFILPYSVLILWITLERLDGDLWAAARGLGATPFQAMCRVTLPLALPGIVAAGTVTAVWGLGAYVGPALFGSPQELTLAVDIQRQAFENQDGPRAAVESLLLLATVGGLAILHEIVQRRLVKQTRHPSEAA